MAMMTLSGCQEPEPAPVPEVSLTLSTEAVSVQYSAQELKVTVTSDGEWGVYSKNTEWLTVSPSGGVAGTSDIKVKIAENETGDVRESELVFTTRS